MNWDSTHSRTRQTPALQSNQLVFQGKIRCPLHNTIAFTALEKKVLNHPHFQRLRRIQQTAFIRYVFPGATHTRFEHSLGVMHMAGVLLGGLIQNQEKILKELEAALEQAPSVRAEAFREKEAETHSLLETGEALKKLKESQWLAQALRLAALLHDVGHGPFSHSCEKFMPTWGELQKAVHSALESPPHGELEGTAPWLLHSLKAWCLSRQTKGRRMETRIRHEIFTLFIVSSLFDGSDPDLTPERGQDISALLEEDIPPAPGGELESSGLVHLLHEIVSGEIDVDRMDYLMRDSQHCGVIYGLFDAGRLLDSTAFYKNISTGKFHLALRRSGVAAYEDYLRARWSMYQQVYFHKTATACEAMLEHLAKRSGGFRIPLRLKDFLALDDGSFASVFRAHVKPDSDTDRLLTDLVHDRVLWKRVYEEVTPLLHGPTPSLCRAVANFVQGRGVDAEVVESSTNLTRFQPRGRPGAGPNTLMVVVKDVHSLRGLEPIENHSRLVNRTDEDLLTRRVFVARRDRKGQRVDLSALQHTLALEVVGES